ncbi:glycosyltransferase [Sphingomonas nostoxanthinifaciens]|uniref:glycosyltransferase n=1 Tax=Sphingomonas nostoxanthinifaciens TaxID=2872652 RepID=UPI001CC1DC7C|nr:glycosyltransferase [Sphingomonas nostoxanthinifaciens]UAK23434.1 glycosyltransferase [Sphingomonas nostoxanthinifaciens]
MTQPDSPPSSLAPVGVVVIGRNEGQRLKDCLQSVRDIEHVAYVDSGSTDGSQAYARSLGMTVVELAVPPNFTAARARNAGLAALLAAAPDLAFVQMVDGDCTVQPEWIATALDALAQVPDLAAVFGRRRERFPDASRYNALCDWEWDVPVGEVDACGGDVMLRVAALVEAGGYPDEMIAGEEPDLSARMRARGWRLWRIAPEMTLHDAAMTRFGQWWNRTRRSGHAFAELAQRHPKLKTPDYVRICRRIILWGGVLPGLAMLGVVLAPLASLRWLALSFAIIGLFCLNSARIARGERRRGMAPALASASGALLMIGKLPQFLGLVRFHLNRWSGRRPRLIEYKGATAA